MRNYLLVASALFAVFFAYLSYSFYGSKIQAESNLRVAQASSASLQDSYNKQAKACLIADSLSVEIQQENKGLEEEKQELLDKIDTLPSKPKAPVKQPETTQNEEIDIDAVLPESIRMLTKQVFDSLQRQGASDAR